MTSPTPRNALRPRTALRRLGTLALIGLVASSMALAGCEKKKKPPPPPPPPPPPAPVIPDPIDVQALLQEMGSDARVQFADGTAPADRSMAEAVIKLANTIAKGDSSGLKSMIDRPSQQVLDDLVGAGEWTTETAKIEQVRVVALSGLTEEQPESTTVGLAVQDPAGAYLLAWDGTRTGEGWTFSSTPSQADIKRRASDFDGVMILTGFTPPAPAEEEFDGPKDSEAPPEQLVPEEERDPNIKRTPSGPVRIPTSPGEG